MAVLYSLLMLRSSGRHVPELAAFRWREATQKSTDSIRVRYAGMLRTVPNSSATIY